MLQAHNENNNNNIALSPYGAASVLIALSEGVQGAAFEEIKHALRQPSDTSVMRVGLRDIHRHLKVSFFYYIIFLFYDLFHKLNSKFLFR